GTVFDCDTVLLSVVVVSLNKLAQTAGIAIDRGRIQTSMPGVFACGNALHVHDIVDNVTVEAQQAGAAAALYVRSGGASWLK
ncbi:MAG: pyridine nucleotide-disulfide oxidoreductase, partial [Oscillospiraceae bacterium]|nr:pyridine nucleotide-disulfide oxidoreductase [Oscillospiraceae bacterium]